MHAPRNLNPVHVLVLLCLGATLMGANQAFALLYDLDFGTPPHTVGSPPATGGGPPPRATVSSINFGTPTVVAAFGALTDQPLEFDSFDAAGDQIGLTLSDLPPSTFYRLETEVLVEALEPVGEFTFLLDTPQIRTIRFLSNGNINEFVPGVSSTTIGTFNFGQVVRLRVDVDLAANNWDIFIDDVLAHSGPFGGAAQITGVRVSTNVTANPPGVSAGIDNLIITETPFTPSPQPCDLLRFEDLPIGTAYPSGAVFGTQGVVVTVDDFWFSVGPCGGATTSNMARVVAGGMACGAGQEIEVNNVTLDFDFGATVVDVVMPFGEYGGTVDLGVNGDCRVVQNFADLDGAILGGVRIGVIDFGQPGQSCGVIVLDGKVDQLLVGGQELFLDNLGFCQQCVEPERSEFEDLPLNATFNVGSNFSSGDATYDVKEFFFPPGPNCSVPFAGGFTQVQAGGLACGSGKELAVNNVNLRIDFGSQLEWLALSYGEYGGNLNLAINGVCHNFENFADISGSVIGGVRVWAIDFGPPGQSCGRLFALGPIDEFIVGGQELWIDDAHACPAPVGAVDDAGAGLAVRATLRQNVPNPFNPSTSISFEMVRDGRARLEIYDIAGRFVQTLVDAELAAGEHAVRWDGFDRRGRRVPSGVYIYRLESDGFGATRRMVVLK